jgi:hypothetical protein
VLLDAPPTIGNNIERAVDEMASARGNGAAIVEIVLTERLLKV